MFLLRTGAFCFVVASEDVYYLFHRWHTHLKGKEFSRDQEILRLTQMSEKLFWCMRCCAVGMTAAVLDMVDSYARSDRL